jgi:hypothetical protein
MTENDGLQRCGNTKHRRYCDKRQA